MWPASGVARAASVPPARPSRHRPSSPSHLLGTSTLRSRDPVTPSTSTGTSRAPGTDRLRSGAGTTYSTPGLVEDGSGHLQIAAQGPGNTLDVHWNVSAKFYGPLGIGEPSST